MRKLLAVILTSLILLLTVVPVFSATSPSDLNKIILGLKKEIQTLKNHLEGKNKTIINLNKQISQQKADLKALQISNGKLITELKQVQSDLERLRASKLESRFRDEVVDGNQIIRVSPEENSVFKYSYYIFIPSTAMDTKSEVYLMGESNNTGIGSERVADIKVYESLATNRTQIAQLCMDLGIIYVMPTFPRVDMTYTHQLTEDAMRLPTGQKHSRLDQQFVAILDDARAVLTNHYKYKIKDKYFAFGFSASAHFADKVTAMYPSKFKAVAFGGYNSLPLYPLKSIDGTPLNFPLGVNNFAEFGLTFSESDYRALPRFMAMGQQDTNDTAKAQDCFRPEMMQVIQNVLGSDMQGNRFESVQKVMKDFPNVIVNRYADMGHYIGLKMRQDLVTFFKANM